MEKPSLQIEARCPKERYKIADDVYIPASINRYLRTYQRDGVSFLYNHFVNNAGCVLADDMGLGKTIQVISFFAAVLKKTGMKADSFRMNRSTDYKFLVVAPTSVLYNWIDELNTWGYFSVGKFHRQNKEEVMENVHSGKVEVVMTTHETMRINIDMLNIVEWSAVILDEAHKIKQPSAQVTIAAKQLNTKCKFGLTGTPLQNHLKELWCLLDWANPHCLGSSDDFESSFARPICIGQRFNANKRELATARKKQQDLNVLHKRWMLRRTKDMIQDQLPVKDEKIVFCSLSSLQVSMYETILNLPKVKRLVNLDVPCDCDSGKIGRKCCLKKFNWRKYLFPYIQILLKTANHAALLLPHHNQSDEQKEMCREICELLFQKYPALHEMYKQKKFSQMSDPSYCGKMTVLQKLLGVLYTKNDKVLLFSHSTQLLNIIEAYVMGRGMIYRRLDGDTPAEKRNTIVKEFNRDNSIFICLLSTTAGSLGLNLTAANFVIIFDPLWNPTYDQQAQDRAYRIGQQRNVFVYRFISVGTIEENIYMRQIYKQQLANIAINTSNERRYFAGVAGDKRYRGELFGIANMFKFSSDHNSILAKETFEKVKCMENGVPVAKYEGVVKKEQVQSKDETEDDIVDDEDHFAVAASQCINDDLSGDDENNSELNLESGKQNTYDDLLAECGVRFAQSTKSVVGSSEEEKKLSNLAMKNVFWDGMNSQLPANEAESSSDDSEVEEEEEEKHKNGEDEKSIEKESMKVFERVGSNMFIIGCTPPAIQAEHFKAIALRSGFDDVIAFAKYVESCTPQNRNKLLKKFYAEREPSVTQLSIFNQIYDTKEHTKKEEDKIVHVCTGKVMRKKTSRKKSSKQAPILKRSNNKQNNWNEMFRDELSDDEVKIKEYDSDNESECVFVRSKKAVMSTPKIRIVDKNKIHKSKNILNTPLLVTNNHPSSNTTIDNNRILKTTADENSQNVVIRNKPKQPINVLDELIFSPAKSDSNKGSPWSRNTCSNSDFTLEDILSSPDVGKKNLYEHSLDELLEESSNLLESPKSLLTSPLLTSYKPSSETNSQLSSNSITTMQSSELSHFAKEINDEPSILDELLDSKPFTYSTHSPQKKSRKNTNVVVNPEPSILDDFF